MRLAQRADLEVVVELIASLLAVVGRLIMEQI
jgi:hypothetical protein